jgi:xylose isomerase
MLVLLRSGGLQGGGVNFDAKLRRNSTDLEDLFYAHIKGMDAFAKAMIAADQLMQTSPVEAMRAQRYASFDQGIGADFEAGKLSLEALAQQAARQAAPIPKSGQQELYELYVSRFA